MTSCRPGRAVTLSPMVGADTTMQPSQLAAAAGVAELVAATAPRAAAKQTVISSVAPRSDRREEVSRISYMPLLRHGARIAQ